MKINTKTRYGVRTIIELAIDWQGKGLFQKEISKKQDISYKYLDHIIAALKAKGLIENVEGKKSGYKLTRAPEQISAYDVFTAFESEISVVEGLNKDAKPANDRSTAAQELWSDLNNKIIEYLKSVSMKELADKQKKHSSANDANMFYI